jgi:predicted TIM-barrel fold metal-dependent hydrolase
MAYRYISADCHLDLHWCPPDLWQSRVPAALRDRAPKVVTKTDGAAFWTWEGKEWGPSASTPEGLAAFTGENALAAVAHELAPGDLPPADPDLMLKHMDRANVYSNVIYGFTRKQLFEDEELGLACNRAFNDFMLELSAASPERIIAQPNLPNSRPEECVKEIYRAAEQGCKGVEYSVFTAVEPIWSPVWEPMWAAAEETGIVVGMHIGAPAGTPYPPVENGRYPAHFCLSPYATQRQMAELVFCGALDRHPNLKVVFGECRVGWLPFFIEHMDRQQRERKTDIKLSLKPSEYWARQIAATFEDDKIGIQNLKHDWSHLQYMVMWGSDYPHNRVVWPDPDPILDELFEGVPADVRASALYGRAAEFYGITLPPSLPPVISQRTPAEV